MANIEPFSDRTAKILNDRTNNWIMTSGGGQKISGNPSYQTWSTGSNEYDVGLNSISVSASSKLDPNSKPFAPRQLTMTAGQFEVKEDGNGTVKWTNDDKMRKIWAGPDTKPFKNGALNLLSLKETNNNNEPIFSLQKAMENHKDDFGLRSLMQNVYLSAANLKSETSTNIKEEDLGFTEDVRRYFSKPAYAYMESPFNNRIVTPLCDYNVPDEYLHHLASKGSLPEIDMPKIATDLLFFLFYTATGDLLQIAVGSELFNRGWRYHTVHKVWVARLPNINPEVRHNRFEQGEYQYFNPHKWCRERKRMTLEYEALASKQTSPVKMRLKRGDLPHFHQKFE